MACAEQGALQETKIARGLGLAFATWRRILKDDADAKALWDEARATERDQIVSRLHERAMEGDTNAAHFLLGANHGLREQGNTGDDSGRGGVVINLPSSLSESQYKRLFEHQPTGIDHGDG